MYENLEASRVKVPPSAAPQPKLTEDRKIIVEIKMKPPMGDLLEISIRFIDLFQPWQTSVFIWATIFKLKKPRKNCK
jgi:hypothetical protein